MVTSADEVKNRIERTLTQLSTTFTVRDIMIDIQTMVRTNNQEEAERCLAEYPDYDQIPLPATGNVGRYYNRTSAKMETIRRQDLISDSTSLLDLLDLFRHRDFFFVLSSAEIRGFVHFSDLNHEAMKLPLFLLFSALESHLAPLVAGQFKEEDLSKVLDPQRVENLVHRMARAREAKTNRDWLGFLNFSEVLQFSRHYSIIELADEESQALARFRNRIAHSNGDPLIEKQTDIPKLLKARDICRRLLNLTTRNLGQ